MNLLSYLFPQTLATYRSQYNGEILVKVFFNKRYIEVGGLVQSGWAVDSLWNKAIRKLLLSSKDYQMLVIPNLFRNLKKILNQVQDDDEHMHSKQIKSVLILGLGGGTVALQLQKMFPDTKMVGVEIDKTVVEAGKTCLGLGNIPNLKIVINDANEFVLKDSKAKEKYDLILVDLYQGYQVPEFVSTVEFLKNLRRLLTEDGFVIFNRLYFQKHVLEADKFLDKLRQMFHHVIKARVRSNLFIKAQPARPAN